MRTAIVTDTTASIPGELLKKHNIHTIPLSVIFEDESYREGIDITTEEFYRKVAESKYLPTTSQPPIGQFVQLYEKLAESYDAIISIHISSHLSGTYDAAVAAGKMVESVKVYPFDSKTTAMAQGFYAVIASEMAQADSATEEIIEYITDMRKKTQAYFIVDDLSHLQRGGRLTSAQAFVGSLLHIKPVLHVPDGLVKPFEKIRTRKKAIKRIMSLLEEAVAREDIGRVAFVHANDERAAIELQEAFQQRHPEIESLISYFGPVPGTHLGEGAIGATWYTV